MSLELAIYFPEDVLSTGEAEGFQWVVRHNGRGFRCGYVCVPVEHPWHGKSSGTFETEPAVHGGVTYAAFGKDFNGERLENEWWIGFDCAHADDAPDPALPGCLKSFPGYGRMHWEGLAIRTMEYVEHECRCLCTQAREAARVGDCQ